MDLKEMLTVRRFDNLRQDSWAWTHQEKNQVAPKPLILPSAGNSWQIIADNKSVKKIRKTIIRTIKKKGPNGEIINEEIVERESNKIYDGVSRGCSEINAFGRLLPKNLQESLTEKDIFIKPFSDATFIRKEIKSGFNLVKKITSLQKQIRKFLSRTKAKTEINQEQRLFSYSSAPYSLLSVDYSDDLFILNKKKNISLELIEENYFSVIDPARQKAPLFIKYPESFSFEKENRARQNMEINNSHIEILCTPLNIKAKNLYEEKYKSTPIFINKTSLTHPDLHKVTKIQKNVKKFLQTKKLNQLLSHHTSVILEIIQEKPIMNFFQNNLEPIEILREKQQWKVAPHIVEPIQILREKQPWMVKHDNIIPFEILRQKKIPILLPHNQEKIEIIEEKEPWLTMQDRLEHYEIIQKKKIPILLPHNQEKIEIIEEKEPWLTMQDKLEHYEIIQKKKIPILTLHNQEKIEIIEEKEPWLKLITHHSQDKLEIIQEKEPWFTSPNKLDSIQIIQKKDPWVTSHDKLNPLEIIREKKLPILLPHCQEKIEIIEAKEPWIKLVEHHALEPIQILREKAQPVYDSLEPFELINKKKPIEMALSYICPVEIIQTKEIIENSVTSSESFDIIHVRKEMYTSIDKIQVIEIISVKKPVHNSISSHNLEIISFDYKKQVEIRCQSAEVLEIISKKKLINLDISTKQEILEIINLPKGKNLERVLERTCIEILKKTPKIIELNADTAEVFEILVKKEKEKINTKLNEFNLHIVETKNIEIISTNKKIEFSTNVSIERNIFEIIQKKNSINSSSLSSRSDLLPLPLQGQVSTSLITQNKNLIPQNSKSNVNINNNNNNIVSLTNKKDSNVTAVTTSLSTIENNNSTNNSISMQSIIKEKLMKIKPTALSNSKKPKLRSEKSVGAFPVTGSSSLNYNDVSQASQISQEKTKIIQSQNQIGTSNLEQFVKPYSSTPVSSQKKSLGAQISMPSNVSNVSNLSNVTSTYAEKHVQNLQNNQNSNIVNNVKLNIKTSEDEETPNPNLPNLILQENEIFAKNYTNPSTTKNVKSPTRKFNINFKNSNGNKKDEETREKQKQDEERRVQDLKKKAIEDELRKIEIQKKALAQSSKDVFKSVEKKRTGSLSTKHQVGANSGGAGAGVYANGKGSQNALKKNVIKTINLNLLNETEQMKNALNSTANIMRK